jgi:sugar lactone lactonase YvrE
MKKIITLSVLAFCLNTNAQIITTVVGNGTFGYSGDGGQATSAELNNVFGIRFDAAGNLYLAEGANSVIRKVNTAGIISTIIGTGTNGYSGDGGQASIAELDNPNGIRFDANGNLYIADSKNNVIRKVNTSGIISTIVGNGFGAGTTSGGYSGDGGPATAAELFSPNDIAFDAMNNLYVSDGGNNVIRKVNTAGIISTFAGNGTSGYSGDGGQASAAELNDPSQIIFDATGNLYFTDNDDVVRKINSAGIISSFAGNGTYGYIGDGGQASSAELEAPFGMLFDAAGNLYIADGFNNRIRMVNTAGIINTIIGTGTQGYTGDGGQASAAELYYPSAMSFDATGNLYFVDEGNSRIRMVSNINNTTSINHFSLNSNQISIYPNPSNGSFTIETNSTTNQTVQLYDVNGKMVWDQTINGKATTIDATNLNEGVYNISIIGNDSVLNKRVVIVK